MKWISNEILGSCLIKYIREQVKMLINFEDAAKKYRKLFVTCVIVHLILSWFDEAKQTLRNNNLNVSDDLLENF